MILKYFQEEPSKQRMIFELVYSFLTHNTQKRKKESKMKIIINQVCPEFE
jgi:hypothetical protein